MRTLFLIFALSTLALAPGFAAAPVATYRFANTLAADEPGVPALTVTDPFAASGFQNDTVFGQMRPVWKFDGNAAPVLQQAGLTLDTTGFIAPRSYSVDMVFLFTERTGAWRRIIDVDNRQTDNGFYVSPSNDLYIYPIGGDTNTWANDVYHHIVLTNDGGNVSAYLDGLSQFNVATGLMNIDNANNPNLLMNFFLDNILAGGQQEFSDGRVALIRVWNGVLTQTEAQQLATNPFLLPGDYNNNHVVDAADYTVWRDKLNISTVLFNDITPGAVTASDYDVWKSHFGDAAGSGSGNFSLPSPQSVPEPALATLLAIGLLCSAPIAARGRRSAENLPV